MSFVMILLLSQNGYTKNLKQLKTDSIKSKMLSFIDEDTTNKGILFGMLNKKTNESRIFTMGAINSDNDLRTGCPTTKPCVSYMILKEGINIESYINKWFPIEKGYPKSDSITIEMLLSNTSGIKDFAKLIKMHPDSLITPIETIEIAYKNNNLNFNPGEKFQYSNTNYNLLGIILKRETQMSFDQLLNKYFNDIAPSLRMDNGKCNYPAGYMKPWPFHWSTTGYAGSLVSSAEDAMKVFSFITNQPEFKVMSNWKTRNHNDNMAYGLGIFGYKDFNGLGRTIYYDGNMVGCQMFILKIDDVVYYFHTAHKASPQRLYKFVRDMVSMLHKS